MANRSKDLGTKAETAFVNVARRMGFPGAERRALAGATDLGDVLLAPGAVVEVKGGNQARTASDLDIERWLAETERERLNARAGVAFLVVQRAAVGAPNAHRWHAYWRHGWIADLRGYPDSLRDLITDSAVIRMSVESALAQVRAGGYGTPLGEAA